VIGEQSRSKRISDIAAASDQDPVNHPSAA
jgi:hypothetical protein